MPKNCKHEKWCKDNFIKEIPVEKVKELYNFLQGELPKNIEIKRPPHLSEAIAFKIIWFLQEQTQVLPDHFEKCKTCGSIYDTRQEGNVTHCDSCRKD